MQELADRPLFRLGKRKTAQPVWFLTVGFVCLYLALALFEWGGLTRMPAGGWWYFPGMTLVCQGALLVGFRLGWIGRTMDRLGLAQVWMVVLQLGTLAWWVPGGRPPLMVFWLLTLSHVASFYGWRRAGSISIVLTAIIGTAMTFRPADPASDHFALGLFSCAQAFAIFTHDWIYGVALRREVQNRTLNELMPVGIFRTSADGRYLSVNKEWQELAGMTSREARGERWTLGLHPQDRERISDLWSRSVARASAFEAEYRFGSPGGRVTWILGRAVPLIGRRGQVTGFLGTATEITDRVRAEQLAEEASRVKTDFLANMSHEIRTPVSGIVGASELISKQTLDLVTRTYVDVIESSADSLLMLIDGLLDLSKIEAGKLELHEVDFVLEETVESAIHILRARAGAKGIALDWHIDSEVPERIRGDSMRLHQILVNLISNAIKFTSEGGVEVRIRSARSEGPSADSKHHLVFEVADTGIGIEPAIREELFEPFAQADSSTSRRYGGSGLGLSICKRMTELMSGEIRVESEPAEGSVFIVRLPFGPASPFSPEPTPIPDPRTLLERERGEIRILVVEDNDINRMIAVDLLEELGYRTAEAVNGVEALEVLDSEAFDLVLMDCQMPEMDGYEATRRIRRDQAAGKRVPIIAVTAHAVAGDRERCLQAGMDDYISKPYTSELLDRTLRRWLWVEGPSSSR